ncbi:hypothetical protein [Paenibacillus larvae]|uniref:hypothetical protein n=1 Tax=Paenibacillus larvae TaxID=1464 RepID=UPI00288F20A1|nr:hypothetical protein [Paenibacillus larvae]MDT2194851.1 hypothetical protein [Paenibacillus larvae]
MGVPIGVRNLYVAILKTPMIKMVRRTTNSSTWLKRVEISVKPNVSSNYRFTRMTKHLNLNPHWPTLK